MRRCATANCCTPERMCQGYICDCSLQLMDHKLSKFWSQRQQEEARRSGNFLDLTSQPSQPPVSPRFEVLLLPAKVSVNTGHAARSCTKVHEARLLVRRATP